MIGDRVMDKESHHVGTNVYFSKKNTGGTGRNIEGQSNLDITVERGGKRRHWVGLLQVKVFIEHGQLKLNSSVIHNPHRWNLIGY